MTENQDQVNILNVTNRVEKTEMKLFSMKFPTTVSNRNITFNYSAKLHNTFVKPSLTSGLSALTITGKPLTKLINSEKRLIRHMFNFRKKATVLPLYLLLGMVPIQINLERETLSLFLNSWTNISNPLSVINKFILKRKMRGDYWINHVDKLLRKYGLSDALTLLTRNSPTKASWKKLN